MIIHLVKLQRFKIIFLYKWKNGYVQVNKILLVKGWKIARISLQSADSDALKIILSFSIHI